MRSAGNTAGSGAYRVPERFPSRRRLIEYERHYVTDCATRFSSSPAHPPASSEGGKLLDKAQLVGKIIENAGNTPYLEVR